MKAEMFCPRTNTCSSRRLPLLIFSLASTSLIVAWCVTSLLLVHWIHSLPAPWDDVGRADRPGKTGGTRSSGSREVAAKAAPPAAVADEKNRVAIAYAVSVSGCDDKYKLFTAAHGAAVLKHSVFKTSAEHPAGGGRYGYKMIAFVHPDAARCSADELATLGYEVMIRDTPVAVADIRGRYLRDNIAENGCCGEKELLKLYAYTLVDYPVVVHLDLDALVLKPLDDLFDAMLGGPQSPSRRTIPVQFGRPMPDVVDAYFARDYMGVYWGGKKPVGVHGGFLVVRPSLAAYDELVAIVREGNYTLAKGWRDSGHGRFHGGATIQGLLPYYYDVLHPGTAVELNRCVYNVVADNPRDRQGRCIAGNDPDECEDCRQANINQVKLAHFTYCQKPWLCRRLDGRDNFTSDNKTDLAAVRLCVEMQREWFIARKDLDKYISMRLSEKGLRRPWPATGTFQPDQFHGYCRKFGKTGYIPFDLSTIHLLNASIH